MTPDPPATLIDTVDDGREPSLTRELQAIYGGDLTFPDDVPPDRPYMFANFVTSLDGVVAYDLPGFDTGGAISGNSIIDHAVMGLLRASADAVIWGAGTYQASRRFLATPAAIWRAGANKLADLRAKLGKPPQPLAVIVTASGAIALDGALFERASQPVVIATTGAGAAKINAAGPLKAHVAVHALAPAGLVSPLAIASLLRHSYGVQRALLEGGPTLLGAFLATGALDELFQTIAPQLVGRDALHDRPTLVGGHAFAPATAPWARLVSLKRGERDLLFARWRVLPLRNEGANG
jgi:riboflavin biosynthesis pyrimidine reductase